MRELDRRQGDWEKVREKEYFRENYWCNHLGLQAECTGPCGTVGWTKSEDEKMTGTLDPKTNTITVDKIEASAPTAGSSSSPR